MEVDFNGFFISLLKSPALYSGGLCAIISMSLTVTD